MVRALQEPGAGVGSAGRCLRQGCPHRDQQGEAAAGRAALFRPPSNESTEQRAETPRADCRTANAQVDCTSEKNACSSADVSDGPRHASRKALEELSASRFCVSLFGSSLTPGAQICSGQGLPDAQGRVQGQGRRHPQRARAGRSPTPPPQGPFFLTLLRGRIPRRSSARPALRSPGPARPRLAQEVRLGRRPQGWAVSSGSIVVCPPRGMQPVWVEGAALRRLST